MENELNEFNEIVTGFLKEKGAKKMTLEDSDLSCWYDSKTGNPDEIRKFLEEDKTRQNDEVPDAIREYLEMVNDGWDELKQLQFKRTDVSLHFLCDPSVITLGFKNLSKDSKYVQSRNS